ncbi:hypothetical protein [Pseudonocardia endophytica]|uniref:Uncharacterized protein n=1 Tax=Pseudonocardia endophytica TaxID=401976 RepID=A0A4R1HNS7_PSEEN|nr:hypothetical protein [Pseudonocardia endophytica]TCK22773.1 hypothetical protein EV378_6782 [Pseudonocardia endophytica]
MTLSNSADVTNSQTDGSGIDPGLAAIIQATEQEQPGPQWINLLAGPWLVQGRPVSAAAFVDGTRDSLFNSVWNTPDARRFRGSDAEKRQIILQDLQPAMGVVEQSAHVAAAVLHLVDVTIVTATGPSLHPPVIRIKANSVDAWWVTDFEVKQPKGGGGIGVGFSF